MSDTAAVPRQIISGGQTGADRGALDAAIELDLDHGGYCPRGRLAEDGPIPDRYRLVELTSPTYAVRTERNVVESDATIVITRGALTGGSALTADIARQHGRPLLVIDLDAQAINPETAIRDFLSRHPIDVLNVAGPRESGCPGIAHAVHELLARVLR